MGTYILKRILLMIPTLIGIMLVSFLIIQLAPGGPIEQIIAKVQGTAIDSTARVSGGGSDNAAPTADASQNAGSYQGRRGLDPQFIHKLEVQFGFDKPAWQRFLLMMKNYATFDFGDSYFSSTPVLTLILQRLPVSISLGLWLTLFSYAVCVPLGIRKAVRDGTQFDMWTSVLITVGYALPTFLLGIMLIVFFAGGSYYSWFPLRGLTSDNFADLTWYQKIGDYAWHLVLPLTALGVGSFATMTMLTKNSFLDEIRKQYVTTARAKGLTENAVLYRHVFRNAMLLVISGFPAAFIGMFFGSAFLIETVFSLDGLGYLGYRSLIDRDYAVVFATLYIFGLIGLFAALLSDVTYMLIDPRLDFEARDL